MGFITTRWEATCEGHSITVTRNEIGRGFALEWDGREIARRKWSWVGLGELHGSVDLDGRHRDIHVSLRVGKGRGKGLLTDGACTITVDEHPLEVRHIR